MIFKEALKLMKEGKAVRLPSWKGYWFYCDGSIKMFTKNREVLDIRQSQDIAYTLENIASDEWVECSECVIATNPNIRELDTIQQEQKLNRVFAVDEIGPGGANHRYHIETNEDKPTHIAVIQFQKGPRNEEDSTRGVLGADLLEIVRDTLISFQKGPYACSYNEEALEGVEKALSALNRRVEDRIKRNVLGKNAE